MSNFKNRKNALLYEPKAHIRSINLLKGHPQIIAESTEKQMC